MMDADARFDYDGPADLRAPIAAALARVVDPELALDIVDIGLVYAVHVGADALTVRMTMTSAACPVTDLIVEEVEQAIAPLAPPGTPVRVDMVWEPPWTPERLSERARRFMGG